MFHLLVKHNQNDWNQWVTDDFVGSRQVWLFDPEHNDGRKARYVSQYKKEGCYVRQSTAHWLTHDDEQINVGLPKCSAMGPGFLRIPVPIVPPTVAATPNPTPSNLSSLFESSGVVFGIISPKLVRGQAARLIVD